MKVLYYNWCPIRETEGGGIAVYIRNIFNYILEHKKDIEPVFLCSGYYYDKSNMLYYRKEKQEFDAEIYSIVNSPVIAPMKSPADNIQMMIEDVTLKKLFNDLINSIGPIDVIHFQTLEGLSLSVLSLKEAYSNVKFIYSMHNYTMFCTNVTLWTSKNQNCMISQKSNKCTDCMAKYMYPRTATLKKFRLFKEFGMEKTYYLSRGIKFFLRKINKLKENSSIYDKYKKMSVMYVNKYCDNVLAVSKRVGEIAECFGVDKNKIIVSYIGTKVAENSRKESIADSTANPFTILYMGYMNTEKGFYFLLDALERIPIDYAKKIVVKFATKITDYKAYIRIKKLKKKFADIVIFNGYVHSDIPKIVEDCHIGIVPVLWEDNLPQVTMEMIANGVPVVASSFGGASELNTSNSFKFNGGNIDDLISSIIKIFDDRQILDKYWENSIELIDMKTHVEQLIEVYNSRKR